MLRGFFTGIPLTLTLKMSISVNKEIETMIFDYDLNKSKAKGRLKNIRKIKRQKCVIKIIDSMKLKLETKA